MIQKSKKKQLMGMGEVISSIPPGKAKLDAHIKNVLAYKPVLSRIFKETVEECAQMTYDEIENCIEGHIDISVVALNPGMTNYDKIEGSQQEDAVSGEGKITFDIRTYLRIPNGSVGIKLFMDVEAQKDDTPGYDIVERGIFYCSRMISAQLSTEFTNHSADQVKYGNLKKVYSIWICLETSDNKSNTIERYRLHREIFPAEKKDQPIPRFDLLEVVIVNISDTYDTQSTESVAIRLLTDLLNEGIDVRKKIDLLQEEYKIKTTVEFEKEVDDMTIFAANYIKRGLEQGIEQGLEQGLEQGREQGLVQGLEQGLVQGREQGVVQGGIQEAVESALEYGISEEKTLDKLVNKYHLSKEDAKKYYDKYATMGTTSY